MIRVLCAASLLALASGIAWGDSVVLADGAAWANMPASIGDGTGCGSAEASPAKASSQCGFLGTGPYWDNDSGKGNQMNVGYLLTGTGGYAGDPDDAGQYLSSGPGGYSAPTSITLDRTSTPAVVTLLGDQTDDMTDQFGYYSVGNPSILYPLFGPGPMTGSIGDPSDLSSLLSGEIYGFYITKDCYSFCPAGDTSGEVTWYSNDSLDTTDVGNQHFAIFDSTTPGIFYIGIEDWGIFGGPSNGEANGDFNDIAFELNTEDPPVPEPATLGLIGAGLLGISLARFRTRKPAKGATAP
jgi:hypothetical protein